MRKHMTSAAVAALLGAAAAAPAAAQESIFDRLAIHGYFTQAYANSSDLPIYGIPTDGTTDYRTAALQFRYAMSPNDNFVFQFKNRRLGTNMLSEFEEDVQLQWAFYQRRAGRASVRVGKVPLPMGLYNETRNVGTLLPFYRAPAAVYPEGVETLDGANVNYAIPFRGWEVELGGNVGAFTSKLVFMDENGSPNMVQSRADWILAGTMMVNTPIPGLRAGTSYSKFKQPSFFVPGEKSETNLKSVSLDGTFDRFSARSEYVLLDWGTMSAGLSYAQLGVKLLPTVAVNGQYEVMTFSMDTPFGEINQTSLQDTAVGVNYIFSSNLVLKLEGHRVRGYAFDSFVDWMGPKAQSDYVISSLSVSF